MIDVLLTVFMAYALADILLTVLMAYAAIIVCVVAHVLSDGDNAGKS